MAGAEAVWAMFLGVVDVDVGWSRADGYAGAPAARLGFRREDHTRTHAWQRVWSLSMEFKGEDFAPLGTTAPANNIAWDFTARVSQQFPHGISVGIGGTYQIGRESRRNTDNQNIVISKSWDSGVTANLHLDRERKTDGDAEAFRQPPETDPEPRQ